MLVESMANVSCSCRLMLINNPRSSIMLSLKMCIAGFILMLVKDKGQLILAGGRGKVKLELYQADRTTLIGPMVLWLMTWSLI
jgi:hypothetical protein